MDALNQGFFSYGHILRGGETFELTPYWKSHDNVAQFVGAEGTLGGLGSPLTGIYYYNYDVDTLPGPLNLDIRKVRRDWRPRLPAVVRVRLTFKLQSPYVGAPDFERTLEEIMDMPSAFVRPDMQEQ
jgi:hypothetical protein